MKWLMSSVVKTENVGQQRHFVVVVFPKLPQKRKKNDNLLKIIFLQITRNFQHNHCFI